MLASPKFAVSLMSAVLALLSAYSFFQPAVLELAQCQQPAANCIDRPCPMPFEQEALTMVATFEGLESVRLGQSRRINLMLLGGERKV